MSDKNKKKADEGPALHEVQPAELTEITGGTIWVGDGYCVSPWRPPLPLPLLAVAVQNPVEAGAMTVASR